MHQRPYSPRDPRLGSRVGIAASAAHHHRAAARRTRSLGRLTGGPSAEALGALDGPRAGGLTDQVVVLGDVRDLTGDIRLRRGARVRGVRVTPSDRIRLCQRPMGQRCMASAGRPRPRNVPSGSGAARHAAAHGYDASRRLPMKKHARLRDDPRCRVFFADDPDDWAAMRDAGRNALRCPEPGCTAALTPRQYATGTRSLAYVPQQTCGHDHWMPTGGGGAMTEQHRWLQRRLVTMTRSMGFNPVAEHPPTRADVYVQDVRLAIEVQLRRTQFEARSAARRAAGAAGVLWMLSPGALPAGHQRHLFEQPAVRWRAVHRHTGKEVEPWQDPSTNADARVQVYGTVVTPSTTSDAPLMITRAMDAYSFLGEVLRGERIWVRPDTPGMPRNRLGLVSGGWVRPEELSAAVEAQEAARAQQVAESRQIEETRAERFGSPITCREAAKGTAEWEAFEVADRSVQEEPDATRAEEPEGRLSAAQVLEGSKAAHAADPVMDAVSGLEQRLIPNAEHPRPDPSRTIRMEASDAGKQDAVVTTGKAPGRRRSGPRRIIYLLIQALATATTISVVDGRPDWASWGFVIALAVGLVTGVLSEIRRRRSGHF